MKLEEIFSNKSWSDPKRRQAMVDAYAPIVRNFMLIGSCYYTYITWTFWNEKSGFVLLVLASISALTAVSYAVVRRYVLSGEHLTLRRLELSGLVTNLLMYANALAYMLVSFDQAMLIYFSLMAICFSVTSVTLRTTIFSIILPIGTLYYFASSLPLDLYRQHLSIGIAAAAFGGLGIATLLRHAIHHQIDARLLADELTAKAQFLADTDMLTGVPNRRAVFQKIDYLVKNGKPFWMGILDLDGFKAINDVYGHIIGDRLLCAVVDRAKNMNRKGVTFGRIGGDEFIAILPGTMTGDEVKRLGKETIETISRPYQIDLFELTIGGSAGFAHFPSMGHSSAQLYEKADFALYKAKQHYRSQCILFNTAEDEEMKQAIEIERELRECHLEDELFLLFQPQYSPSEQRVVGFEALARWQNPKLGLVRPDQFIRAAERSGHIRKVTGILFKKGLACLARWPKDISLSFNLSAQDISDRAFILSLLSAIVKSGISPHRIEFEITETAVMSDLETSNELLEILRSNGCKIALDDFGSGYSSFEYIDQLPLDKVKIDRSFIRKVTHSATSREIVAGIVGLCGKLELRCVLEGVETQSEMDILSPMKPDLIQGYLYGRPMTDSDARQMIARQQQPVGNNNGADSDDERVSLSA